MDLIRKNSSFQAIELKLVLLNSSHQDDLFELLLSQIVPNKEARHFWKYVDFPHFDQKVDFLWLQ